MSVNQRLDLNVRHHQLMRKVAAGCGRQTALDLDAYIGELFACYQSHEQPNRKEECNMATTTETTYEQLDRKIAEVRALAYELRTGADELDASANYWAAVNEREA